MTFYHKTTGLTILPWTRAFVVGGAPILPPGAGTSQTHGKRERAFDNPHHVCYPTDSYTESVRPPHPLGARGITQCQIT
jgi:hypothetical protein